MDGSDSLSNEVMEAQDSPWSWLDLCPCLILVRTFRLASGMRLLILAAAGTFLVTSGWWAADRLLLRNHPQLTASVQADRAWLTRWPSQRGHTFPHWQSDRLNAWLVQAPELPVVAPVYRIAAPLCRLLDGSLSWSGWMYYAIGGVWTLCVWGLFGGAIARVASIYLGREEQIGLRQALSHAATKWSAPVAAVMLSLLGFAATSLPLIALGWVMRFDAGLLLAGLGWILVITAGFIMTVFAAGLLFGWPLMWGAVASEASDSFDAISRAYAYTFQRPLQYGLYALFAIVFGLLGWVVVWIASEAVIHFSFWGVACGMGPDRSQSIRWEVESFLGTTHLLAATPASAADPSDAATMGQVGRSGIVVISLAVGAVRALASAFAFSYFWCASTGIYLLLRLHVDEAELDDIHLETETAEGFGLPVLPEAPAGPDESDSGEATTSPEA